MKENNGLFSIGMLAKLSGVHIRCLRYYEKLGILKPEYIDRETGYRYYTYRQMRVVEAIQYCVELDIPLKKFAGFLSEEDGQIDYAALMAYGRQVTEEKMQSIRVRQRVLQAMAEGMEHARRCAQSQSVEAYFPERYVYTMAYDGSQADDAYQAAIMALIKELQSKGLKAGYDIGILVSVKNGQRKSYCFADIKQMRKDETDCPQITRIPAGKYICVTSQESTIAHARQVFCEQFEKSGDLIILETELFLEKFSYTHPVYELRCLVERE